MALIDEVKKRVTTQRLIQLTNTDSPNATTVNDTILGTACTDASENFKVLVGVDYDNTNPIHVANIIDGVVITLMKWAERWNKAVQEIEEGWHSRLGILRLSIGGNTRLMPQTNSELTPSTDKRGVATSIVRPDFDSSRFDTLRPNSPFGSDSDIA